MMLPPENMEISRKETIEHDFGSNVPGSDEKALSEADPKNREFYKRIEANKRRNYYLGLLRHPIRTYIRSYYYGIGLGICFAGIVAAVWLTGGFDTLIPHDVPEAAICLMIIAFMAPVAISYEGRRWYVKNIESHLPDFLRELSDMKDIGITLHEAIHRIAGAKLGVSDSELSVASRDIESGAYVNSALVKMEERIGLVSVKRAISLLVRASEITTNLKQIFIIAITDFEYYLKLKRERSNTTIIYVMIIYLSFGIYLYTAYQPECAVPCGVQRDECDCRHGRQPYRDVQHRDHPRNVLRHHGRAVQLEQHPCRLQAQHRAPCGHHRPVCGCDVIPGNGVWLRDRARSVSTGALHNQMTPLSTENAGECVMGTGLPDTAPVILTFFKNKIRLLRWSCPSPCPRQAR